MSTDATHRTLLPQLPTDELPPGELVLHEPPVDDEDAMDTVLLAPLHHGDDHAAHSPSAVDLLRRAFAATTAVHSAQTMLAGGFGALVLTCTLAGLVDPAAAPSLFLVALGVSTVQPLVLGRRVCALLTAAAAAAVALPPLLRNLWLAAGIPQVVARALLDGQFVSLHSPALRAGQLSPLPAVHGLPGLLLAVACIFTAAAAARSARQALRHAPAAARLDGLELGALSLTGLSLTGLSRTGPRFGTLGFGRRRSDGSEPAGQGCEPSGPVPRAVVDEARTDASDDDVRAVRSSLLARLPRQRPAGESATTSRDDVPVPLPSLRVLVDRTTRALSRTDLVGGDVGLFVLQIDRFDALADALGPASADDLVRQVARRLRAWLPADDIVARLGTGTFGVLVEGLGEHGADTTGCDGTARRMTALLREPMTCDGQTVSVTFSIGIATSRVEMESAEALLRAAYEALEVAQRGGRARWVTFDGDLRAQTLAQGTLELDLRRALRERRVRAAFQPMVRLGSDPSEDRVIAMEALPRWTRPDGTAVDPSRFVPLAEEIGLGPVLGLQVLQCGLDAVAGWYADDHAVGRLAITLAQSQLDDPQFVPALVAQLARRDLPASCLVAQVASGQVRPSDQAVATLEQLRELGVEVLLDDFGVQGLSLSALRSLPLSGVKLDRSVCAGLAEDAELASALLALCRSLGLRCVIEGIESQVELDAARALRADAVQGFFIGPPARARDVTAMLQNARST